MCLSLKGRAHARHDRPPRHASVRRPAASLGGDRRPLGVCVRARPAWGACPLLRTVARRHIWAAAALGGEKSVHSILGARFVGAHNLCEWRRWCMCRPPPRPSPLRSWRVQPTPHAAWTYRTGGTSHVCVCGVRARGEGGHRGQPLCSAQGPVVVCAVCVALDIYSHVWAPSTRTAPSSLISHAAVWRHV